MKLKNNFFFSDTIDCSGYVITPRWLHIFARTIDAVRDLKFPATTSEWRLFLELCTVFRQFVLNLP